MLLKAVVFDLDGTLVTAEVDFAAMRRDIRDLFVSHGFPAEALPMTSTQELLRTAFSYAEKQGMSPSDISTLRAQAFAIAEKLEWEGARKAQLVPGAREALVELQRRGVKAAVLTNGNRGSTNYLLEKFRLHDLLDIVVTRDDAPQMKPATDGLEIVLHQLNVTRKTVLFVGDARIDLLTARKMEIEFVVRLSGVATVEQLKTEGATAFISTLTELIPYLEARNRLPPPSKQSSESPRGTKRLNRDR